MKHAHDVKTATFPDESLIKLIYFLCCGPASHLSRTRNYAGEKQEKIPAIGDSGGLEICVACTNHHVVMKRQNSPELFPLRCNTAAAIRPAITSREFAIVCLWQCRTKAAKAGNAVHGQGAEHSGPATKIGMSKSVSKSVFAAKRRRALAALATASLTISLGLAPVFAAGEAAQAAPPTGGTTLELNKLEPYEKGCRAYMVVNNGSETNYQSYKLEMIMFQSDGVIGKRFALDLAPIKPQKKTVKLFELEGVGCDKIGSLLINEVMECKTDSGAQSDCLQKMTTSTLTNVQFSK